MWRIHKAVLELTEQGIKRVKEELGEDASYGQVKVHVWGVGVGPLSGLCAVGKCEMLALSIH
jgi:hypothetical protein